LERRVHFDPRSRANEDAAPTLARQAWAEDRLLERGDRRLSQVDPSLVARVINEGYAPDLSDDEIVQIGRDPFLIAYALASPATRCVVTTEVSAPSKQRQNRRIPDVCASMGVVCCNTFVMMRTLGFKTGWSA